MSEAARQVPAGGSHDKPKTYTAKAFAASSAKSSLGPLTIVRRDPRPQDVQIEILYCGVCHSDLHQVRNEWEAAMPTVYPVVPGHEIVGRVVKVGTGVKKFKEGDIAAVGCLVDSCRVCGNCKAGNEQYCENGFTLTYNAEDKILGGVTCGGYSESVVVDEAFVVKVPKSLDPAGAAPLLCAGITLYSPLRHWHAGPGKKIAILGLGGLGHMGVKLGHAMGAEITVLSHSTRKQDDAKRLGADAFFATADGAAFKKLAGYFDLIICTVGTGVDWNAFVELLKLDGSMVVVGVPEQNVPVSAMPLVGMRRSISGSMIGGIKETQEMLDFCGAHDIAADIETIPIQKVNEAFDRVVKSDVRYRFVIDIASLKA